MDKLTRSLIGEYNCVLNLRCEISHEAVCSAKSQIDLEDHIRRSMAGELAKKLITDKSTVFNECREPGENIVFTAKIIAMSEEEITAVVDAAYQAGLDSKET